MIGDGPLSRGDAEMGPLDHEAIAAAIASSRPVIRAEHEETLLLVVDAVRALDARLAAIEERILTLEGRDNG